MAYRARDKLKMQREKLGDRKSEITILLDTDKMPRIFPSILHQLRYQWKRQQTISGQLGMQANMAMSHMVPPEAFYSQPPPVKNTEDIFAMIKEFAEKEEPEEEHMESDWFGFFTRNKQFKVEVDFYRIHKEPF